MAAVLLEFAEHHSRLHGEVLPESWRLDLSGRPMKWTDLNCKGTRPGRRALQNVEPNQSTPRAIAAPRPTRHLRHSSSDESLNPVLSLLSVLNLFFICSCLAGWLARKVFVNEKALQPELNHVACGSGLMQAGQTSLQIRCRSVAQVVVVVPALPMQTIYGRTRLLRSMSAYTVPEVGPPEGQD
ncbi:hypothetical protein BDZ85DRAFT_298660 [Elsinoe ampelina]|uniref:Uncharacterized protein n=1 Tax=Elsinoe ampelina TaxID=302913 RepID=A0A6A6G202_9PEZI|nr:hypothetical protein BDZ85DRAFT_298660 [Elsinoe ampelina]